MRAGRAEWIDCLGATGLLEELDGQAGQKSTQERERCREERWKTAVFMLLWLIVALAAMLLYVARALVRG